MIHARPDYNRIQDPAVENPDLISNGATPIAPDEPVFLLRAKDVTAAKIVRAWAHLNSELGGDPEAIKMAMHHANLMEKWPNRKLADV